VCCGGCWATPRSRPTSTRCGSRPTASRSIATASPRSPSGGNGTPPRPWWKGNSSRDSRSRMRISSKPGSGRSARCGARRGSRRSSSPPRRGSRAATRRRRRAPRSARWPLIRRPSRRRARRCAPSPSRATARRPCASPRASHARSVTPWTRLPVRRWHVWSSASARRAWDGASSRHHRRPGRARPCSVARPSSPPAPRRGSAPRPLGGRSCSSRESRGKERRD